MRHFLFLRAAIARLAGRVLALPTGALLVPGPGSAQRLPPGGSCTPPSAVDLPPVTAVADQGHLPAACTAEEPQRRQLGAPPAAGVACRLAVPVAGLRMESRC